MNRSSRDSIRWCKHTEMPVPKFSSFVNTFVPFLVLQWMCLWIMFRYLEPYQTTAHYHTKVERTELSCGSGLECNANCRLFLYTSARKMSRLVLQPSTYIILLYIRNSFVDFLMMRRARIDVNNIDNLILNCISKWLIVNRNCRKVSSGSTCHWAPHVKRSLPLKFLPLTIIYSAGVNIAKTFPFLEKKANI